MKRTLVCLMSSYSILGQASSLTPDRALAEKFSPVIVNEERYVKQKLFDIKNPFNNLPFVPKEGDFAPKNQLDRIDKVFYDVSETSTHIFISYQIMKAWSSNPMPGISIAGRHAVDSEDVYVVLRKDLSGPKPVVYVTNRHGQRAVYPVESEVDAGEYKKLVGAAKRDETDGALSVFNHGESANLFGASEAIEKTFKDSDTKPEFIGNHVVAGSSYSTHAVTRARVNEAMIRDATLVAYVSNYAGDARDEIVKRGLEDKPMNDKVPAEQYGDRLRTYELAPVADQLVDMIQLVKTENRIDKMNKCKISKDPKASQKFSVIIRDENGVAQTHEVDASKFPSHYDPTWYFTRHRPNMLPFLKEHEDKLKFRQKADTVYSGHGGILETSGLCMRLMPAEEFCKALPETCRKHGVNPQEKPEYLRYDLIKSIEAVK